MASGTEPCKSGFRMLEYDRSIVRYPTAMLPGRQGYWRLFFLRILIWINHDRNFLYVKFFLFLSIAIHHFCNQCIRWREVFIASLCNPIGKYVPFTRIAEFSANMMQSGKLKTECIVCLMIFQKCCCCYLPRTSRKEYLIETFMQSKFIDLPYYLCRQTLCRAGESLNQNIASIIISPEEMTGNLSGVSR